MTYGYSRLHSFVTNSIPQNLFIHSPADECLYYGAKGTGKSLCLLWCFLYFVGRPGYGIRWKGIALRRNTTQLSELTDLLLEELGLHFRKGSWEYHKSKRQVTFATGEKLTLTYMDGDRGPELVQGGNMAIVLWDELPTFPTQKMYSTVNLETRTKSAAFKTRIRATANPSTTGGGRWVHKYFIKTCKNYSVTDLGDGITRQKILGRLEDNLDLRCGNEGGAERYKERIRKTHDEKTYRMLALGEWPETCDGFLDGFWDESTHVISPFQIPAHWKVERSMDWGTARPFSVLWFAKAIPRKGDVDAYFYDIYGNEKKVPKGTVFCISELYGGIENEGFNWPPDIFSREVLARDKEIYEKYGTIVHPGAADRMIFEEKYHKSIAMIMAEHGLRWKMADQTKHSRVAGAFKVKDHLRNSIIKQGSGFYCFSTCVHFIDHVPNLPASPKTDHDVDTDALDHDWDALRYYIHNTYEESRVLDYLY